MLKQHGQFSLKIHEICNESCIFCFQEHSTRAQKNVLSLQNGIKDMYSAYQLGYRNISFTGGEPLMHREILKFLLGAKKMGYLGIGMHTNAIKMKDKEFVESCVSAGLNMLSISLHHTDESKNDAIVRRKGGTRDALIAINYLQEFNVHIIIHIVLNQFNYRDIKQIVSDFFDMGIVDIVIMFPTLQGSMKELQDVAMVEYHQVIPYIRDVLSLMHSWNGRYITLFNIPPCLLPGYERYIMNGINGILQEGDGSRISYFNQKKNSNTYIPECESCTFRNICPGIDMPYVDAFGMNILTREQHSHKIESEMKYPMHTRCKNGELSSIRDSSVYWLKKLLSEQYLMGRQIPQFDYIENTPIDDIVGALQDLYRDRVSTLDMFQISTTLLHFPQYHHIEYAIKATSSDYRYIFWFEDDRRYEILNYIFLTFSHDVNTIRIFAQIFIFLAGKNLPFHLGIDSVGKRMKLYISLYHESQGEGKSIVDTIISYIYPGKHYQPSEYGVKYDCIGIDITKGGLDIKVYELVEASSVKDYIINPVIRIKEAGYMHSLTGRKKAFFRLEKNYDFHIFGEEFFEKNVIKTIQIDAANQVQPQGRVKYYCDENGVKEIYFI